MYFHQRTISEVWKVPYLLANSGQAERVLQWFKPAVHQSPGGWLSGERISGFGKMSQYYWEKLRAEKSSSILGCWPKGRTEGMQSFGPVVCVDCLLRVKQQALAQASFCVPVLWHEMCSRTPQACVCVWMFALCVVSRMAVLALQWYHWTTASWESRSPGGVTCGCGGSCHTLITHLQSGSWLSLLSVLPVLMWALKFLTGFLRGSIV